LKKSHVTYILGGSLFVIFLLGVIWILAPYFLPYAFTTFAKVSGIYDEPITIKINWESENELQVGKPVKLSMELRDLPYSNSSIPLEDIIIRFDERDLNYLHPEEPRIGDRTYNKDFLTFIPDWEGGIFISDEIWIRFIVPTDISVQFCDPNLKSECTKIEKIIHPAPHDLAIQIKNNQIGIAISLVIASFSILIIWTRLREKMEN